MGGAAVISLMRDRYVHGWPRHEHGDRVFVRELGKALTREYSTDAHFAAYRSPNGRRLVREAIDLLDGIELTCIVFDIDCVETHGTSEPAPEFWRCQTRERVLALTAVHPGAYYYETRGGARIVYRQAEPTVLRTQGDGREWSRVYAVAIAHLARRFHLVCDPACHDWQRLFRLPRATRTAGGKPESWPTLGDPNAIGALLITPSIYDVEHAERHSRAFRDASAHFTPSIASGEGLLYYLLRARGDVSDCKCPRGGWIVRCPNRTAHTRNTDGTDSTVLYPPLAGKQIGAIECKHAHCQHFSVPQWLRFFSDRELAAARSAAGITRAA
jgi:hypothetical protein